MKLAVNPPTPWPNWQAPVSTRKPRPTIMERAVEGNDQAATSVALGTLRVVHNPNPGVHRDLNIVQETTSATDNWTAGRWSDANRANEEGNDASTQRKGKGATSTVMATST